MGVLECGGLFVRRILVTPVIVLFVELAVSPMHWTFTQRSIWRTMDGAMCGLGTARGRGRPPSNKREGPLLFGVALVKGLERRGRRAQAWRPALLRLASPPSCHPTRRIAVSSPRRSPGWHPRAAAPVPCCAQHTTMDPDVRAKIRTC